jgi:hypothetical protein
MPYFDYCLSLFIYFNKDMIRKLAKLYYTCLTNLLKLNFHGLNYVSINQILHKYNLFSFQHGILFRLLMFVHKIKNDPTSPIILKEYLQPAKSNSSHDYYLRETVGLRMEFTKNKYGDKTFFIFAKKLINKLDLSFILYFPFSLFKAILHQLK